MCLTFDADSRVAIDWPKVADKDIEVWKVLGNNDYSPFLFYQYKPGQFFNIDSKLKYNITNTYGFFSKFAVNHGFHAFMNYEKAKEELHKFFSLTLSFKVVKMVIPKGSEYILGNNNEIVANKIYSGDLVKI